MKNMRTQKLSVDLMQKTFDKNNPLEITQGDTGNEILLSINANADFEFGKKCDKNKSIESIGIPHAETNAIL